MSRLAGLLACAGMFVAFSSASAQNAPLDQLYGDGVHAYFGGNFRSAFDILTFAAESGSTDPRIYYFRGLSQLRLGREPDAALDFARGAKLETADGARYHDVSRALERVQGRDRLTLERQRAQARLIAQREIERMRYERYERIPRGRHEYVRGYWQQRPHGWVWTNGYWR